MKQRFTKKLDHHQNLTKRIENMIVVLTRKTKLAGIEAPKDVEENLLILIKLIRRLCDSVRCCLIILNPDIFIADNPL